MAKTDAQWAQLYNKIISSFLLLLVVVFCARFEAFHTATSKAAAAISQTFSSAAVAAVPY